jgi:hypothetical protein
MSTTPSRSESQIRIFSASSDARLNQARALLLRQNGFEVMTSESPEHARQQLSSTPFDVLVFGSTLDRRACWDLAEVFRGRNDRGKIIEILPNAAASPKNHPDALVVSNEETSRLVPTIYENLRSAYRDPEDERWKELCSQAAVERDPAKLMKLLEEINRILTEREERRKPRPGSEQA